MTESQTQLLKLDHKDYSYHQLPYSPRHPQYWRQSSQMKTIIERGASWTLEETKLLLSLWGQDLVQRQATAQKRTKEVYEKISEKFNQSGFERTPDQVRTRVFNMIAEYRRILRDPSPERMKKCIFFEALHRIYQAKHMDDVKSALDDYEPECPYSPASNTISSERGDESVSDGEALDETLINNNANTGGNNDASTAAAATNTANSMKGKNASATSDNVADSINTNNDNSNVTQNSSSNKQPAPEKEDATNNPSAKKIKLESPKAGSSQTANSTDTAGKHKSASSSSTATNATNPSPSTANNNSGSRHQSLLLPHATTASASTPINKLTYSNSNNSAPAYINVSSSLKNVMGTTRIIGSANGNESANINGTPTANRLPTTAAITSHQFYQAPVNTFDVTSSALLIDRMFAHLSREEDNMREWIALEKDRIALERARRVQEAERETRRERILIDTLMKFNEQWIAYISRRDNSVPIPTLNIPPRENPQSSEQQGPSKVTAQGTSPCTITVDTSTTNSHTASTTPTTSSSNTSSSHLSTSTASADASTTSSIASKPSGITYSPIEMASGRNK